MKKIMSIILCLAMAFTMSIALTGCNNVTYKAVEITGIEVEEYGFAIDKLATNKTEVLTAMNEVITELGSEKIMNHLTYHSLVEQGKANEAVVGFEVTEPTTSTTNGTLVMCTNAEFPPYEYVVGTNNVQGLDVDMMKLVANKLGMAFSVVNIDFDSLSAEITNLEAGKTKVIAAGMTINAERLLTLDFSNAYMTSIQYMVCAEDAAFDSLDDLAGKKIGVQLGTTGDFLIDGAIESGVLKDSGATLTSYKSAALAFAALKAGKIDVVVIDEHPAQSLISNQ